jgi:hypothetical protein
MEKPGGGAGRKDSPMLATSAFQQSVPPKRDDSVSADLSAARRYLRELAGACIEGAISPDPRVTLLALGLVARAGEESIP